MAFLYLDRNHKYHHLDVPGRVSVLLDLSNFYDKIDHDLLIQDALELGFPPMILYFPLMIHKGPRVLVAETVASEPIQPKNGILAG